MRDLARCLISSFVCISLVGCAGDTAREPTAVGAVGVECPADARVSDADIGAIRQSLADAVGSALEGDWQAFSAQFTDDVVIMPPGAPAFSGREPLRESFAGVTMVEFVSEIDELDGCGALAYGRGHHVWAMRIGADGAEMTETGKWAAVWRKQPDGRWLVALDIWNGNGAPAP